MPLHLVMHAIENKMHDTPKNMFKKEVVTM